MQTNVSHSSLSGYLIDRDSRAVKNASEEDASTSSIRAVTLYTTSAAHSCIKNKNKKTKTKNKTKQTTTT